MVFNTALDDIFSITPLSKHLCLLFSHNLVYDYVFNCREETYSTDINKAN